ncbi:MAG: hypothetical protein ABSF32_10360 [Ignavibacteria bacterium]|jgi:hypothetical protein
MKRNFIVLNILLLILIGFQGIYAQEIKTDTVNITTSRTISIVIVRTVPRFILQLSGGYNFGALELSAHNGGFSRDDFNLGKSYCARNGYGFNLMGKLSLRQKSDFWLDIFSGFTRFQSDLVTNNTGEGRVGYNLFGEGAGLEYNFTPAHRIKYYVGAIALLSIINGKATGILDYDSTRYDVKINTAVRLGYSLFIGLEYAFEKNVGFNFGLKWTHANLLLKNTSAPTDKTVRDLNDLNIKPWVLYSGWKQFAYVSVYAGVSYYFGVREKRYKL